MAKEGEYADDGGDSDDEEDDEEDDEDDDDEDDEDKEEDGDENEDDRIVSTDRTSRPASFTGTANGAVMTSSAAFDTLAIVSSLGLISRS